MLNYILKTFNVPLGIHSFDSSFCYGAGSNTKAINKANKEMNSENNQTQIDLWNQQKEYDYQMWQENNAYNDPSQQVQRLKSAGINPALALSNISTGTSQSSAGGQSLPVTNPSHFENPTAEVMSKTQNIALIGRQLSDISKQAQETQSIQLQNAWTNTKNTLDVAERTRNMKLQDEAIYSAKRLNMFNDQVFLARQQQEEERANILFYTRLRTSIGASMDEIDKDIKTFYHQNLQPQELEKIKADVQNVLTDSIVKVFDAKTRRLDASTNQFNAQTNRMQFNENVRVDDSKIKQIDSLIANSDADTETKKFWNSINSENKRWIVTKIVSDAKNSSLDPLWKSLGTLISGGATFGKFF